MGLIKTAILTGGGIYAVNKIAKTAETRHNQTPPNYPPQNYGPNYPPQGYWGPPPQGPPSQGQQQRGYPPEGYYNNGQGQQQWGPPPNAPQFDKRPYNDTRYALTEGPHDSRGPTNSPPAYYQQPQYYNNMAPQGQAYDSVDQKESSSSGAQRN